MNLYKVRAYAKIGRQIILAIIDAVPLNKLYKLRLFSFFSFSFFFFFDYLREEAISESANKKVRVFFNRATERHAIFFRGKRNDKERIAN